MSPNNAPAFTHISAEPLHPSFGAEISGLDFHVSDPSDEALRELLQAVTKVCISEAPFNSWLGET